MAKEQMQSCGVRLAAPQPLLWSPASEKPALPAGEISWLRPALWGGATGVMRPAVSATGSRFALKEPQEGAAHSRRQRRSSISRFTAMMGNTYFPYQSASSSTHRQDTGCPTGSSWAASSSRWAGAAAMVITRQRMKTHGAQ